MTRMLLAAGLLLLLLLVAHPADAASPSLPSPGCGHVSWNAGGGTEGWIISINAADTAACNLDDSAHAATEGTCTTFTVKRYTTGTPTAQAAPTGIHVYVIADLQNRAHGTNGDTGWTALRDTNIGTTLPTTTSVCRTRDASSTGASAPGAYRVVLRVCSYVNPGSTGCTGTTANYDVNTDDMGRLPTLASVNAYSSPYLRADVLSFCENDSNAGPAGPNTDVYVAGDTPSIRYCFHAPISDYSVQPFLRAPGVSNVQFPVTTWSAAGTGEVTATMTQSIRAGDGFVDGTTYSARLALPSIMLTTNRLHYVNVTSPGQIIGSTVIEHPWGSVEKALTPTCPTTEHPTDPSKTVTRYMRGEPIKCRDAALTDARGSPVASGTPIRINYRHDSRAFAATLDAPACDTTLGTLGAWTCDATFTSAALSSRDAGYMVDLRTFTDASRTTELARGTASLGIDVYGNVTVTTIHAWINQCDLGTEYLTYVVAADVMCIRTGPVLNGRGELHTVSTTFVTTYHDNVSDTSLPTRTTSGITTATEPDYKLAPQPPASTQWAFHATVTDVNGNEGDAWRVFTWISPYATKYDIACLGTSVATPPGKSFNVTCQTQRRSDATGVLEPYCSDEPPQYRINTSDTDGAWQSAVPTTTPPDTGIDPCTYWVNWTVPQAWPKGKPALLHVAANFSGVFRSQPYPLSIQEETGSDPLLASATFSWDTHRVSITLSARYANGTGRPGLEDDLDVRLYAPDGTTDTIVALISPAIGAPGVYYARVHLGIMPQQGEWLVTATAPQPDGINFATIATSFLVPVNETLLFLDQRQLTLDMWASFNQTLATLCQELAEHGAHEDDNFAYTWSLLNATHTHAPKNTTLSIHMTGDAEGPDAYVGRDARLEGLVNATGTGAFTAWFWTWDHGDNTTSLGPTTYHAWAKPGTYRVTARATDALGTTSSVTLNVTALLSKPHVEIVGPTNITIGHRATWTIGSTSDPHDDLATTDWEVDPMDVEGWLVGKRHLNKGWCNDCDALTTTFLALGKHTIQLTARNAHDVTNTTSITVHVHPPTAPAPGSPPLNVGQDDLARANENARDFMETLRDIIHWITG